MRAIMIPLFLLFIIFAITNSQQPDLVIEVFRHGARAPLNNTYDPDGLWAGQYGELTGVGQRMHYILGMALRKDYPSLLNSYNPSTIYAQSTDVNRTIMSAYSQLYGIYNGTGPGLPADYNASLAAPPYASDSVQTIIDAMDNSYAIPNNFQPIPVHVTEAKYDTLLLAQGNGCPSSSTYSNKNLQHPNVSIIYQNLSATVDYLNRNNVSVKSLADLYSVGDTAVCNLQNNFPLPGNMDPKSQVYEDVFFAMTYYFTLSIQGQEIQRQMNAYNLFYTIYDHMNGTYNGTSSLKYIFYSAHDSTLTSILSAMGFVSPGCLIENYYAKLNNQTINEYCLYPIFASSVKFEFYKNNGNPYVKILYNDKVLPICNNVEKCSFSNFYSYIQTITGHLTPNDFASYCGISQTPAPTGSAKTVAIIFGILSGILLIALIALCLTKPKESLLEDDEVGGYSLQGKA